MRLLIVDDNKAIHADYRKVLETQSSAPSELERVSALMFGAPEGSETENKKPALPNFTIDSAYQGEEALELVRQAKAEDRPYGVAFVDMRMPPGWDGLRTIAEFWKVDPEIEVVVCTAYSDQTWETIIDTVGHTDKLLILKKPFDAVEVRQLACALSQKWRLARESRRMIDELLAVNGRLELEVEQRLEAEDRLRHEVHHDALTNLPNRTLISERIERCIKRRKRDSEYHFAVLCMDLDDFKVVNESLGPKMGDELLVELSQTLVDCLRSEDCASRIVENTTSRFGGDEFVVLLDGLRTTEDAEVVAMRIRQEFSRPVTIQGQEIWPTVSIGVAYGRTEYDLPDEILRDADSALHRAKGEGKDAYVIFEPVMRTQAMARLQVENDLHRAIDNEELFLQYQPIVSLNGLTIEGFEALVRWQHPEKGLISPGEFIPVAEESGLILPLGWFVLRKSCEQAAAWAQRFPALDNLSVSVNVSSKQFLAPEFFDELDAALENSGLSKERLKLELTESRVMENSGKGEAVLEELRRRDMALHMDDFGTGYSSLSYLHKLPITAVKLDRSFIAEMLTDPGHTATIKGVLGMAQSRNMKVIAEGVEELEQLVKLQGLGCDFAQGYYFSPPVDVEVAERMLGTEGHGFRLA